jgi:alpha/beta superfamily hydrolase
MEPIAIETADGLTLVGELRLPDDAPRAAAVICHPHPLHGGSKDHPLLWAIRADLSHRGFGVLSFNFRGVMGSGGAHDHGIGELRDVRAAIGLARARAPGPILLVGWSFGANVALRAGVEDDRVAALALVGMPLAADRLPELPPLPPNGSLASYDRPVVLLSGDADPYSPAGELRILGRKLPDATVDVRAGANHYFTRREREAAAAIGTFAQERLLGGA